MRKFEEADRKKKSTRIEIPENPAGLSDDTINELENRIKAALKVGYLPCGVAWKIARETGVPKIAVGEIADSLGVRITNCQIGCFKVDKTVPDKSSLEETDSRITGMLEDLKERDGRITCAGVFEVASRLNLPPMSVADVANLHDMKVLGCQLGCF